MAVCLFPDLQSWRLSRVCSRRLAHLRSLKAGMFRALGNSQRWPLLTRLAGGPVCVTELAEQSGELITTVSARLKTLRTARSREPPIPTPKGAQRVPSCDRKHHDNHTHLHDGHLHHM
jgi:hypothetical protein